MKTPIVDSSIPTEPVTQGVLVMPKPAVTEKAFIDEVRLAEREASRKRELEEMERRVAEIRALEVAAGIK